MYVQTHILKYYDCQLIKSNCINTKINLEFGLCWSSNFVETYGNSKLKH